MTDYRKIYYRLVWEIDEALTLMDDNDLLKWDQVKKVLQDALLEAEDEIINSMEPLNFS